MINDNRIVQISTWDLISMFGLILTQTESTKPVKLDAAGADSSFEAGVGTFLASEPVATLNFTGSSGTVFFVPAYNYTGFKLKGVDTVSEGAEVNPNARELYKAVLASGKVTITKLGL